MIASIHNLINFIIYDYFIIINNKVVKFVLNLKVEIIIAEKRIIFEHRYQKCFWKIHVGPILQFIQKLLIIIFVLHYRIIYVIYKK